MAQDFVVRFQVIFKEHTKWVLFCVGAFENKGKGYVRVMDHDGVTSVKVIMVSYSYLIIYF
jgi:hypothetical protein